MITIDFYNKTKTPITATLFKKFLEQAQQELIRDKRISRKDDWNIEVTLVGTKAITELNTQYHNKPRPTDVVSVSYFQDYFEQAKKAGVDPLSVKWVQSGSVPSPLAGEIFISIPYARMQAKKIGQSLNEELQFLFTHGLLHVFGYDHMVPDEEAHMLKLTYKILDRK